MLLAVYLFLITLAGLVVALNIGYLLLLLLAAFAACRAQPGTRQESESEYSLPRLLVVIPAHDEAPVLANTLCSLAAQDYSSRHRATVVIADNCTDSTARIARQHGVAVLERLDTERRGKGYALEWAFNKLLPRQEGASASRFVIDGELPDGFVIVDADTWVAPDFLSKIARCLQVECRGDYSGFAALQGRYGVLNQDETWRTALMAGAFDLFNHIKPLGQNFLGMSVGLKGNGMAFTRPVIERAPWRGHSITEDIDYGLDLLYHHGIRVGYLPGALVRAQMPATAAQARSQRSRWEGGKYRLVRERVLPLIAASIRRRDTRLLDAACALMALPLSEIAAGLFLLGVLVAGGTYLSLLSHPALWWAFCAVLAVAFASYVLAGLYVAGASRTVYASLLKAPFYAIWKLALYSGNLLKRGRGKASPGSTSGGTPEWVRTERAAIPPVLPVEHDMDKTLKLVEGQREDA